MITILQQTSNIISKLIILWWYEQTHYLMMYEPTQYYDLTHKLMILE